MGWQPIETAPKDGTKMLWTGRFKPYDILPGGEWETILVRWSTIMSDGTGYQWISDGWSGPEVWNVEWTYWQPLPDAPDRHPTDAGGR